MSKGRLYTFSGPDGVGKSTQARLTREMFSNLGYPVSRVWSRGGHTPMVEASKNLVRLVLGRKRNSATSTSTHSMASSDPSLKRKWVLQLYLLVSMLDLMFIYGVVVRWRRWRGQVVVCDRYLWDTAIDYNARFAHLNVEKWLFWRLLVKVAAKPDKSFVLWAPPDIAASRSIERGEDTPAEIAKMTDRAKHYLKYMHQYPWQKIDARLPIEEVWSNIQNSISTPVSQAA